jgi:hypothetical protein
MTHPDVLRFRNVLRGEPGKVDRIGAPAFATTSNDINALNTKIQQLASDGLAAIQQSANSPIGASWLPSYLAFQARWLVWKDANSEGTLGIPLIVQSNITPEFTAFEGQYNTQRAQFILLGGKTSAPISVTSNAVDSIKSVAGSAATVVGVGALLVGLFLVAKLAGK